MFEGITSIIEKYLPKKTTPENTPEEGKVPPAWAKLLGFIVNGLGGFIFASVAIGLATYFESEQPIVYALHGLTAWVIFYVCQGLQINHENEFIVIERFGQYYRTKMSGGPTILCLQGFIDKIAPDGGRWDFKSHRLNLFEDEVDTKSGKTTANEIDFKNGSAPVNAQIWYKIQKDEDSVYKWTYAVKDTENRIEEIFDGVCRPIMQTVDIDHAQQNLSKLADEIISEVEESGVLKTIGVVLDYSHKGDGGRGKGGFILTDIQLPQSIKDKREQTLKGQKDAEEATARAKGYIDPIMAIVEASGDKMSIAEATSLYETQRGLETIAKTGANITFLSPDIKGVNAMIGVNQGQPKDKK